VELLLIRHALPVRLSRDDGGAADPHLSAVGQRQVERLAAWLESERIDAIYTSPLRRARQTALPLAARRGLEPVVEPGVVEFDHQSSSYVPLEEIKATDYERWRALVVDGGLYAGVDLPAFRRSVSAAFERIIAAHPGGRVAVACHGGVINAWTAEVLGVAHLFVFEPAYTGISRFLAAGSGERSVMSLNETAHLRDSRAQRPMR
jgi:probable phosphoglycerate mutase